MLNYEVRILRVTGGVPQKIESLTFSPAHLVSGDTGLATVVQKPEIVGCRVRDVILKDIAQLADKQVQDILEKLDA